MIDAPPAPARVLPANRDRPRTNTGPKDPQDQVVTQVVVRSPGRAVDALLSPEAEVKALCDVAAEGFRCMPLRAMFRGRSAWGANRSSRGRAWSPAAAGSTRRAVASIAPRSDASTPWSAATPATAAPERPSSPRAPSASATATRSATPGARSPSVARTAAPTPAP